MNWQKLIEELRACGLTFQAIADAAGMSKGAVHDLLTGKGKTVVYETGVLLVAFHKKQMRQAKRRSDR